MEVNKKLKRIRKPAPPNTDGTPAYACYTYENDPAVRKFVTILSKDEAHAWFHGHEKRGDVPETDPTVDEMLEVIAEQLRSEVAIVMETALESNDHLAVLYRAAKKGTYPMTGRFRLLRPCW